MIEWMRCRHRGKSRIAIPSLLATAAILILACERSPYKPSSDDAATIYMDACLPCHQGGSTGPSLAGRALTPEAVNQRLDRGGKGMPSFPGIRGRRGPSSWQYVVRLSSPANP